MSDIHTQYMLSWQSFQANISNGLTHLQQNGEFVDMTLAAEGHFVKVHQMVVAIASPYLKELITSAPCPHPVMHLQSINFVTLCSLLEYIYTGEVLVSADNLNKFIESAKALHIKGLEELVDGDFGVTNTQENVEDNTSLDSLEHNSSLPTNTTEKQQVEVSESTTEVLVTKEINSSSVKPQRQDTANDFDSSLQDARRHSDSEHSDGSAKKSRKHAKPTSLQYTISIRGYLQVILNRYLYNLHSTAQRSGVRRWRCVDYRNKTERARCRAYLVTKGNLVVNRGNMHNHGFHDKKILDKINRKIVYSAIGDVSELKDGDRGADKQKTLVDSDDMKDQNLPDRDKESK